VKPSPSPCDCCKRKESDNPPFLHCSWNFRLLLEVFVLSSLCFAYGPQLGLRHSVDLALSPPEPSFLQWTIGYCQVRGFPNLKVLKPVRLYEVVGQLSDWWYQIALLSTHPSCRLFLLSVSNNPPPSFSFRSFATLNLRPPLRTGTPGFYCPLPYDVLLLSSSVFCSTIRLFTFLASNLISFGRMVFFSPPVGHPCRRRGSRFDAPGNSI